MHNYEITFLRFYFYLPNITQKNVCVLKLIWGVFSLHPPQLSAAHDLIQELMLIILVIGHCLVKWLRRPTERQRAFFALRINLIM